MNSSAFTLVTAFGLVVGTAGSGVIAQDQFDLDVGLYPGLNMSGTLGTVYSIEYADDPANPDPGGWHCLEFVQLPASPYLWVGKSALATTKRFYRAVEFAVHGVPVTEGDRITTSSIVSDATCFFRLVKH
jgi:hypothetical protein